MWAGPLVDRRVCSRVRPPTPIVLLPIAHGILHIAYGICLLLPITYCCPFKLVIAYLPPHSYCAAAQCAWHIAHDTWCMLTVAYRCVVLLHIFAKLDIAYLPPAQLQMCYLLRMVHFTQHCVCDILHTWYNVAYYILRTIVMNFAVSQCSASYGIIVFQYCVEQFVFHCQPKKHTECFSISAHSISLSSNSVHRVTCHVWQRRGGHCSNAVLQRQFSYDHCHDFPSPRKLSSSLLASIGQ